MAGSVMSPETANAVYDLLTTHADAPEGMREDFVHHQTTTNCREYRFGGNLGFGGKFWRGSGFRADGTFGEDWYVSCYPEDETSARRNAVTILAPLLDDLRARHETTTG